MIETMYNYHRSIVDTNDDHLFQPEKFLIIIYKAPLDLRKKLGTHKLYRTKVEHLRKLLGFLNNRTCRVPHSLDQ